MASLLNALNQIDSRLPLLIGGESYLVLDPSSFHVHMAGRVKPYDLGDKKRIYPHQNTKYLRKESGLVLSRKMLEDLYGNINVVNGICLKNADESIVLSLSVAQLCGHLANHPGFIVDSSLLEKTISSSNDIVGVNLGSEGLNSGATGKQIKSLKISNNDGSADEFTKYIDESFGNATFFEDWSMEKTSLLYGSTTTQGTKLCVENIEYQQRILYETYREKLRGVNRVVLLGLY